MWIVIIIIVIIVLYLFGEPDDGKNDTSKVSQNNMRTQSSSNYLPPSEQCKAYVEALNLQKTSELSEIVDQMIGDHWACVYADDLDTAIMYESTARDYPYIYPIDGDRTDCRGLSLHEIFGNQNVEIRARKNGKAPYTTPLPFKPK